MDDVSVFEDSGVFSLLPPFNRSMTELRLVGVEGVALVRGVPTGFDEVASEVAGAVPELTPVVTTGAVCSLVAAAAGFDIGLTSRLSIGFDGSAARAEGLLTCACELAGAFNPFLSSMLRAATPAVGSASCGAPLEEVAVFVVGAS